MSTVELLKQIQIFIKDNIDEEFIKSLKTKKGNTQEIERKYIQKIEEIFD